MAAVASSKWMPHIGVGDVYNSILFYILDNIVCLAKDNITYEAT